MAITHTFTNPKSDGGDATIVRPSDWNAAHTIAGTLAWDSATVTTDTPLLNLTQTWNASGVTFTGLKLNVTNTASAAASLLADLQVGGNSQFSIRKDGALTLNSGTTNLVKMGDFGGFTTFPGIWFGVASPSLSNYSFLGDPGGGGTLLNGPTYLGLRINNSTYQHMTSSEIRFGSDINVGFSPDVISPNPLAANDTKLYRDAAGIFAQRNSTTAQTLRVYNTYTDASNYERGVIDWTTTSNVLTIGTQAAGTGANRSLALTATQSVVIQPSSGGGGSTTFGTAQVTMSHALVTFASGTITASFQSPSTLASGSTHNYNSGQPYFYQRLTANAANSVLTGFASSIGINSLGQFHYLFNIAAAGTLTLNHQDTNSTAGNRFLNSTGANIVLSPNQGALMFYDDTDARWRVFKLN